MGKLAAPLKTRLLESTSGYQSNLLLQPAKNTPVDRRVTMQKAVIDSFRPIPPIGEIEKRINQSKIDEFSAIIEAKKTINEKHLTLQELAFQAFKAQVLEEERERRKRYLSFGLNPEEMTRVREQERENFLNDVATQPLNSHAQDLGQAMGQFLPLVTGDQSFAQSAQRLRDFLAKQDTPTLMQASANDIETGAGGQFQFVPHVKQEGGASATTPEKLLQPSEPFDAVGHSFEEAFAQHDPFQDPFGDGGGMQFHPGAGFAAHPTGFETGTGLAQSHSAAATPVKVDGNKIESFSADAPGTLDITLESGRSFRLRTSSKGRLSGGSRLTGEAKTLYEAYRASQPSGRSLSGFVAFLRSHGITEVQGGF